MDNNLLDLKMSSDGRVDRETLAEYEEILSNPDLLGRLFRLFIFQNTHKNLWKDSLADYIEDNRGRGSSWVNDISTNLTRTLFRNESVTWRKFLEGLVVLLPAFDMINLTIVSSLNSGKPSMLRVKPGTLELDAVVMDALPKGSLLFPEGTSRTILEPLPLRVVRDAMSDIRTATEFRTIVRSNLKDFVPSEKMSSSVNSLYISALKPTMSWNRMRAILFALGATQVVVTIRAYKNGKEYSSVAHISR